MQEMRSNAFGDRPIGPPMKDGKIIVRRRNDVVETNVPHLVTHHSPTGFEFGYGGSGPADLALNIVEYILREQGYISRQKEKTWDGGYCFAASFWLSQTFKWFFLAKAGDEIVIPWDVAVQWVRCGLASMPSYLSDQNVAPDFVEYDVDHIQAGATDGE
jgi:hypothetical protein